jgi:hypothetical protein
MLAWHPMYQPKGEQESAPRRHRGIAPHTPQEI